MDKERKQTCSQFERGNHEEIREEWAQERRAYMERGDEYDRECMPVRQMQEKKHKTL